MNIPAEAWKEWYACLSPASSLRVWLAAWHDRTAEMLKMMEAFSNASEYCAVALCVKASNLQGGALVRTSRSRLQGKNRDRENTYQVKETLMCCSSTGKRRSSSSSWP